MWCNQKKEGSKPNSTLTICATLSDLIFADLLHHDKTSDLLPYTSLPTLPVYILWSETYASATHINQHNRIHNNHHLPFTFIRMSTITHFPTADCSSKCRLQKLPKSTGFLTTKCSSKIRFLLRSSLSHVHLHQLGQVAGAVECSNNQPSPLLTELLTPTFTKIWSRVQASCLLNVPQKSDDHSAIIALLAEIRHLDLSL